MNQKILVLCIALALAGISCKKETGCGEYATTEPQVRWSNCRFEGCPNQPFQFTGTPGIWWLEDCFAYINFEQLNPSGYPTDVKLRCINPDNGQLKWETSLPDFDLPAKLIPTGNEICLYDEQGKIFWLGLQDGVLKSVVSLAALGFPIGHIEDKFYLLVRDNQNGKLKIIRYFLASGQLEEIVLPADLTFSDLSLYNSYGLLHYELRKMENGDHCLVWCETFENGKKTRLLSYDLDKLYLLFPPVELEQYEEVDMALAGNRIVVALSTEGRLSKLQIFDANNGDQLYSRPFLTDSEGLDLSYEPLEVDAIQEGKVLCTRNVTGRLMDAQNGHIIWENGLYGNDLLLFNDRFLLAGRYWVKKVDLNTGCEVQEYKFSNFADMYLGAVADPQTGRCFYVGTKNVVAIDNLLD